MSMSPNMLKRAGATLATCTIIVTSLGVSSATASVTNPVPASASIVVDYTYNQDAMARAKHDAVRALTSPIYMVKHSSGNTLLTPWIDEAENAVNNLGWDSYEVAFYAALNKTNEQLIPVYRMYNPTSHSFMYTASEKEVAKAVEDYGFNNEGVRFYVPSWDMTGTTKVYRTAKVVDGKYRYREAAGDEQLAQLQAEGWNLESQTYRAMARNVVAPAVPEDEPVEPELNPKDGDGSFTYIQIGDTQEDVWPNTKSRFNARIDWILNNEDSEDIRFVGHTGDIVNWWNSEGKAGYVENHQYKELPDIFAPLFASDIPFAPVVGNHDTLAVADGDGWANTDPVTGEVIAYWGLRQTDLINQYIPVDQLKAINGKFEEGKWDNSYHTFTAEGADFLVLSLELYPRNSALDWAENVIKTHPNHNVIIQTHHFLNGNGSVDANRHYGDNSAKTIEQRLVDKYSNVKMVLSGHTGSYATKVRTAPNGNKVVYSMNNLSRDTNGPLSHFNIDVDDDKLSTKIFNTVGAENTRNVKTFDIDWIEK